MITASSIVVLVVIATLGHGGMAEVFLAVAVGPAGFNKLQVIKRLRPSLAEEAGKSLASVTLEKVKELARHRWIAETGVDAVVKQVRQSPHARLSTSSFVSSIPPSSTIRTNSRPAC